jgi:hypothetical protein
MTSFAELVDAAVRNVPGRRHIQSIVVAREGEVQLERYSATAAPPTSATFIQ